MIKDEQGRITQILLGDPVGTGHSVCTSCGKDMPGCWDVVCHKCNKTLCYDCAHVEGQYWLCNSKCIGKEI